MSPNSACGLLRSWSKATISGAEDMSVSLCEQSGTP
jgi:hypothetical protein